MLDIALIMISGLLVYIIGYPIVMCIHEIKEEMEEKQDGSK